MSCRHKKDLGFKTNFNQNYKDTQFYLSTFSASFFFPLMNSIRTNWGCWFRFLSHHCTIRICYIHASNDVEGHRSSSFVSYQLIFCWFFSLDSNCSALHACVFHMHYRKILTIKHLLYFSTTQKLYLYLDSRSYLSSSYSSISHSNMMFIFSFS